MRSDSVLTRSRTTSNGTRPPESGPHGAPNHPGCGPAPRCSSARGQLVGTVKQVGRHRTLPLHLAYSAWPDGEAWTERRRDPCCHCECQARNRISVLRHRPAEVHLRPFGVTP